MLSTPFQIGAAVFAVVMLAGGVPWIRHWSGRGLHVLVSLSAGLFLGTIFLHLLPELGRGGYGYVHAETGALAPLGGGEVLAAEPETFQAGAEPIGHTEPSLRRDMAWMLALVGFLVLFFVEKVWLEGSGAGRVDSHRLVWYASYVGLGLHALLAGFSLTSALLTSEEDGVLILAMVTHKAGESLSLSTIMRLADLRRGPAFAFMVLFALLTPLGILLGSFASRISPEAPRLLTGLATGTFLYVAICDLLPEVFHEREHRLSQAVALLGGIALAATWQAH